MRDAPRPVAGRSIELREVDWLVRQEWAVSADDILWRRGKLGVRFGDADRLALEEWLAGHNAAATASVGAAGH